MQGGYNFGEFINLSQVDLLENNEPLAFRNSDIWKCLENVGFPHSFFMRLAIIIVL